MWVFYLISLPLTLGMVAVTLRYFAGPEVPRYVLLTVGYTWFSSLSIIILVPADIWTVRSSSPSHFPPSFDFHIPQISWQMILFVECIEAVPVYEFICLFVFFSFRQ